MYLILSLSGWCLARLRTQPPRLRQAFPHGQPAVSKTAGWEQAKPTDAHKGHTEFLLHTARTWCGRGAARSRWFTGRSTRSASWGHGLKSSQPGRRCCLEQCGRSLTNHGNVVLRAPPPFHWDDLLQRRVANSSTPRPVRMRPTYAHPSATSVLVASSPSVPTLLARGCATSSWGKLVPHAGTWLVVLSAADPTVALVVCCGAWVSSSAHFYGLCYGAALFPTPPSELQGISSW